MSRLTRRPVVLAVAGLGLGLLAYQLVPRDEARIAARLDQLCSSMNQTRDAASLQRLRQGLPGILDPEVQLRVVELNEELSGLSQVTLRAEELLSGAPLTFALSAVKVQITAERARVDLDLLVTISGSGEQRRDLRRTRVFLRHKDATWLIEQIVVEPIAPSEPEPRP